MTTENIDIRVSEDGSRVVRRRLDDIADGADRAYSSTERLNSLLKTVAKYLAVTEVMRWADAWSVAASSIKIATNNTYEFVQVQADLFKVAQRSRQEFGALAELYAAVARQSENLQTTQKGLLLYTENISKALAIQHTSMSAARGPLLQLGQAMASGTIRAQEFNSIMLGLPYVMKIVADNFKGGAVSVMQLRQMMLKGKLESKEFFEAFQRGTDQINKDFEKTQITFSQAFTIFKNELIKFTGTMDSTTGAAAKFASVLKFVADNLALLTTAAAALALGMKFGPIIAGFIAMQTAAQQSAAAVVAANLEVTASENAKALANIESARATVAGTQADLASVAATQAAIVVSREAAIATLAKANSDIIAARASLQAATNAGALSYALAVKRESELALVAAETRRSASLAELAVLGQQQARVTVIQTEATAAHTAAVRALSIAQGMGAEAAVAYGASQTAAAAATGRIGIAAGAATIATRLFSGAVALMGGPIGIAITALAALGMWLYSVKSNADEAKDAIDAVNRVNAAKAGGPGVRQSDAQKIQQQLDKARKEQEDAEDRLAKFNENLASKRARGYNKEADELKTRFGATFQNDVTKATEKVQQFSKAMEDAKDLSVETGGAAGKAAREVGNARAAWEASNKGVKTATGIQEAYRDELEKSRAAHKTYIDQLKKNNTGGVNDSEIARANKIQAESEISMAKERDAALKRLNNMGAGSKKQIQLEVDERMSIIQSGLDNELSVRNKAYESEKRILDARHQNGILSEAEFMAQNLQMVQRYDQEERAIIMKASQDQKAAYEDRRAYIEKALTGKRQSDELKKLEADYVKFVDSTNSKLAKLDISAFERQTIAIAKLSGEIEKVAKQDDQYWRQANANADKEQAAAAAKRNLAFATEEQQAAYEAYMQTGEKHNAQLERLEEAYNKARDEADKFSASIDWREAGADTIAILGAMNLKADEFAERMNAAYGKMDQLRNRAAAAAAESVRNKEFNKNVNDIADAIETAIFEGGKQGGKKFSDWMKNYFIRNPIRVLLQGTVSMIGNALGLGGGGGVGAAAGSSILGNIGTSIASNSIMSSIGGFLAPVTGALSGFTTAATAAAQGMLGITGTTAQMVTSLTQAGHIAAPGMGMGMNIFSAIPGWGWAIAGIAALAGLMSKKATPHAGAASTFSASAGLSAVNLSAANGMGFMANNDEAFRPFTDQIVTTLATALDSTAVAFGKTAGYQISAAFADDTSKDGAWGQLIIERAGQSVVNWGLDGKGGRWAPREFGDGEAGQKEYMAAIASSARDALKEAIGDVRWAKDMLDALGNSPTIEQLSATVTQINQAQAAIDSLGKKVKNFANLTSDAVSSLVDASGGMQSFLTNMQAYYDNFYTDGEKVIIQTRDLQEVLSKYGVTLPKTREEYRKLAESQDLNTDAGRKLYAVLISLAPSFAEVTQEAETASDALDRIRSSTDQAYSNLESAIDRQITQLEDSKSAIEQSLQVATDIFNTLDAAFKNMFGSVESGVQQNYIQSKNYLSNAAANPGMPLNKDELSNAIAGIDAGMSSDNFKTKTDYDRERLTIAGQYDKLRAAAKRQMTLEEQSLEAINRQIDQLKDMLKVAEMQLDQLRGIDSSVQSVEQAILSFQQAWLIEQTATNGGTIPGTGVKPGGGGGTTPEAGRGVTPRVSYGADQALSSFELFKDWYQGIRNNADPSVFMNEGYKVPDWMRYHNGADDGTDKELFGSYLFFKNNPQYAKDFEQVYTTGRSSYATDGSTLLRSDLSKMPADVAAYYKSNPDALAMAEGFALDPVLSYQLYNFGPGQFGLDQKKQSFTEWLQNNKWTASGIISNNNVVSMANTPYAHYQTARWDTSTGNIIDLDGTIYTPDGKRLGSASRAQLDAVFGAGYTPRSATSDLYNSQVGSGKSTSDQYYTDIRRNLDAAISAGWSAQQLADAVRSTGASMQDVARAYNVPVQQIIDNLKAGGATNIPGFANGGLHSGGLRIVGERGWELEATGASRIWNQSQLGSALAMGVEKEEGDSESVIVSSMAGVVEEIDNLRRVSYGYGRAQTLALNKMAKLMEKNDKIGVPPTRDPVDA